ncbi:MAG: hypothetical protein LBR98_00080 [Syntrophomonadaceae bacterium]|jgi:phosphoribosylaminoimidazole-succinocarboxamide synthase|nr:hypothetical protein [Syntrophomonadaceae bacterium]
MIISEGKTKRILTGPQEHTVLLETYDVLTGGDAAKKARIEGIGTDKTSQAANVFSLLKAHGIPTAFIKQYSSNQLLCWECDMIPLEIVIRRYAWGSYLFRNPEYKRANEPPYRFSEPLCEFFHKWSVATPPLSEKAYQLPEEEARDKFLQGGVWAQGIYTDPYIFIEKNRWKLFPQKENLAQASYLMSVPALFDKDEINMIIKDIALPAFKVLEQAWKKVTTVYGAVELIDLKIELGKNKSDDTLVIADVIDNDSWRIWPGGDPGKQLDKQCFRDDDPLATVMENYNLVTELTQQFVNN